ncbi:MAG: hypothetical protein JST63_04315 [Bacteroidetes bacterium]|nr:hypothetical protein [Bacteroidota bacterium]
MKLKTLLTAAFIVCALSYAPSLMAQPVDPGQDPDVPIDGGVSLLIAAGVAYGAKKAYDKRKKEQQDLGAK